MVFINKKKEIALNLGKKIKTQKKMSRSKKTEKPKIIIVLSVEREFDSKRPLRNEGDPLAVLCLVGDTSGQKIANYAFAKDTALFNEFIRDSGKPTGLFEHKIKSTCSTNLNHMSVFLQEFLEAKEEPIFVMDEIFVPDLIFLSQYIPIKTVHSAEHMFAPIRYEDNGRFLGETCLWTEMIFWQYLCAQKKMEEKKEKEYAKTRHVTSTNSVIFSDRRVLPSLSLDMVPM